ncbi:MAG: right-handed parallel beta-helix repeat-containing protein [Terriglobales bacterium]
MKPRLSIQPCFGLAMLAILWTNLATAATITVTNTNDNGPGSLRAAIAAAAPGDTIDFSLPFPETITLTSAPLVIYNSVTISGPGPLNLAISADQLLGVFQIAPFTPRVAISGLTIQGGGLSGNQVTPQGGGIFNEGQATITNCTVTTNQAAEGGGIYNHGTMTITNSTISGNGAEYGGGILNQGAMTVINSTISQDGAVSEGGGVYNEGTLTLTNSTLFGSTASNSAGGGGGGIFNTETLTVNNTTIYDNCAGSFSGASCNSIGVGGAIFDYSGTLEVKNSILANNGPSGNCAFTGTYPLPLSFGHNLSDDDTCYFFTAIGDELGVLPGLDPNGIESNGGPTKTIALLPGSPAIDAIPVAPTNYCTAIDGTAILTDQRGVARPQGVGCDSGAFEVTFRQGTKQTLTGTLTAAGHSLERGDDEGARIELEVFLGEVGLFKLAGQLTYLEAAPLASADWGILSQLR